MIQTFVVRIPVLILGLSIGFARSHYQPRDSLFLKEGAIVRGTVIELIPPKTVSVQLIDGTTVVYKMSDITRIALEQKSGEMTSPLPSQRDTLQAPEFFEGLGGTGVIVFAGVSLPTGSLAATYGEQGGAGTTGFAIGIDGSLALSSMFAWMTSIAYSVNSMDIEPVLKGTGFTSQTGNWNSVWALTGVDIFGDLSPGVQLFSFVQAGVLFGTFPRVVLAYETDQAIQKEASGRSFAYSIGAGMKAGHFSAGIRYLSGKPSYSLTASGPGGTFSHDYSQPTSVVAITVGFAF